jgi:DNA-binding LacI/PurR family transcriptional regulator
VSRRPSLPTLKDVAERAGVSPTTASMALSGRTGSAHLSAASIARVRRAADELGYRGNYHARTLSTGRSQTIGLAVGSGPVSVISHRYWGQICGGVESAARARGFDLLLVGGTGAVEPLERATHHLEARRVDALIVLRALYPELPQALLRSHLPIVVYDDHHAEEAKLPRVRFDDRPGTDAAVAHLAELGHRELLWVGPGPNLPHEQERLDHVRAAAAPRGLRVLVHHFPPQRHSDRIGFAPVSGFHQALRDLPLARATTAIMCWNEAVALAVNAVLAERGLVVPRDVSIIGFDDLFADLANPTLTTISHACAAIGEKAIAMAAEMVDGSRARTAKIEMVPASLVIGNSTGPAPR